MSQLAIASTGLDLARLTCGHQVYFDRDDAPLTSDGWYAALPCDSCRRPRAVVSVLFDPRKETS